MKLFNKKNTTFALFILVTMILWWPFSFLFFKETIKIDEFLTIQNVPIYGCKEDENSLPTSNVCSDILQIKNETTNVIEIIMEKHAKVQYYDGIEVKNLPKGNYSLFWRQSNINENYEFNSNLWLEEEGVVANKINLVSDIQKYPWPQHTKKIDIYAKNDEDFFLISQDYYIMYIEEFENRELYDAISFVKGETIFESNLFYIDLKFRNTVSSLEYIRTHDKGVFYDEINRKLYISSKEILDIATNLDNLVTEEEGGPEGIYTNWLYSNSLENFAPNNYELSPSFIPPTIHYREDFKNLSGSTESGSVIRIDLSNYLEIEIEIDKETKYEYYYVKKFAKTIKELSIGSYELSLDFTWGWDLVEEKKYNNSTTIKHRLAQIDINPNLNGAEITLIVFSSILGVLVILVVGLKIYNKQKLKE